MGKAIIFSAPSGSGKTTIVKHLLKELPKELQFSTSATTREPRADEENGKDYYFLNEKDFRAKIAEEAFVEWEEVYPGRFYGTLKSEVEKIWIDGKAVVFDVDVKGGLKLKEYFREKALALFVRVPSLDQLEERLLERGSEDAQSLNTRLSKAKYEMTYESQFDFIVINEYLAKACNDAKKAIVEFLD